MRGRRRLRRRRCRGGDRRLGDEGRGRGGGGGGGDSSRRAADAARPVLAPMAPANVVSENVFSREAHTGGLFLLLLPVTLETGQVLN